MEGTPCHITVAGRIDDAMFHIARTIAEDLSREFRPVSCEILPMVESEWDVYLKAKRKYLMNQTSQTGERNAFKGISEHKLSPLVFYNGIHYISNLNTWSRKVYDYEIRPKVPLYKNVARNAYKRWFSDSPNKFVYMDIQVGEKASPARVIFELYSKTCPKTCDNFIKLCSNAGDNHPSYKNSLFHRVVPGGWVQGGDIDPGSSGDGGVSVFEEEATFADETFAIKHDTPGVLAMACKLDQPHSNGSQFYVTLAPQPWLDYKRVAFGRIISGVRVFRLIEKLSTKNQRPVSECKIVDCGEYSVVSCDTPKEII